MNVPDMFESPAANICTCTIGTEEYHPSTFVILINVASLRKGWELEFLSLAWPSQWDPFGITLNKRFYAIGPLD
jgi:hypothetical protein